MDQIVRKMNMDKISDKFLKYCFDRNIFYYDSTESYFSRKEPTFKRKAKFYLRFLLLAIFTIKYGLLSLYPDNFKWLALEELSIIFGEQANLFHALEFGFAFLTLVCKLIVVYFERRKNFYLIDFFCQLEGTQTIVSDQTKTSEEDYPLGIYYLLWLYENFYVYTRIDSNIDVILWNNCRLSLL